MKTMQFLWANLHFSVSIYPYPRLIDIIFPDETKTETQSAYLKRTPDKMESVSLENTKAVPFNKGVVGRAIVFSIIFFGWFTVPERPTNVGYSRTKAYCACSRCGMGLGFSFFNYEDMFIISHLTYLPFLMPHRLS